VLALVVGEQYVGLQITCNGGVSALRGLDSAMETESGARVLHGEVIAREARITLGQLSADLRESVNGSAFSVRAGRSRNWRTKSGRDSNPAD